MTDMWRISVAIPKEVENAILELRNREKFRKYSYSELVRYLLKQGIQSTKDSKPQREEA